MKKNILITLSLVIAAIMASCDSFTSQTTPIAGTDLAYFTAQDANKAIVYGVKKFDKANPNAETTKVIPAVYSNIKYVEGTFVTARADSTLGLLGLDGKPIIAGDFASITKETADPPAKIAYLKISTKDGKDYVYHPTWKLTLGPDTTIFGTNEAFVKKMNGWQILGKDGKELIAGEYPEILVIKLLKADDYHAYLVKNTKDWSLYGIDGKLLKKSVSNMSSKSILKAANNYKDTNKSKMQISWITLPKEPEKY